MPSVIIGELRDTRRLKARLRAEKTVELRERQQVIGRIVPAQVQAAPEHWPTFQAAGIRLSGSEPGREPTY